VSFDGIMFAHIFMHQIGLAHPWKCFQYDC